MASDTVEIKLRQKKLSMDFTKRSTELEHSVTETSLDNSIRRRLRPKSASYAALRSAVFQLTCLGDFTKEKIGSGFFADVFKVKHKVTGEVMVLKMNKSKKTSKQMLSEIQLMNRLSHPNILRFKGSCVHEGQLHALTEFINGGSLEDLLHDRSVELSWSMRVKIARDIARGMAYLHSRGIFHRDLNSRNCLIRKEPDGMLSTVVADFGLAAKIKQRKLKSYTETVGSPYWMAPECLNGKQYCELADVFSFGITLAEIMTRMPADPDYLPRTSQYGVNHEAMRLLCSGCPEELFQLMCNCCQLDPDDRPSFEEVVQILESIPIDIDDTAVANSVQQPSDANVDDDDRYLRSCFSEPFLKLTDETDSGGSSVHLGYRLDSMGSSTVSTGSSSGSYTDILTSTEQDNRLSSEQTIFKVNKSKENVNFEVDYDTEILRSVSDNPIEKNLHQELKKTSSLTLSRSNTNSPDLNCSIQTLIAEDSHIITDTNGGGDSGIDPGETEVFKFPPHDNRPIESKLCISGAKGEKFMSKCSQTSNYSNPTRKAILEASINLTPGASSPHALSPVRTASDSSVSCTNTTPSSPYAQSWASSEFSFHLPNPSTPYAPPCTPTLRQRRANSCPSSPKSHSKPFRFSFDTSYLKNSSVDSDSPASYHRRLKWASSRHSTNCSTWDSLEKDFEFTLRQRKHSHNPRRRSVHFDDSEVCINLDRDHFSKMSLSRNRSHSNPAQPIKKHSAGFVPPVNCKNTTLYSLTLADYKNNPPSCTNTALCKGYNVTMTTNARLSSSVPNLFV